MQKRRINPSQIVIVILIVVAVLLLLDYQNRRTLLYQVETQRDIIEREVIQLKQTEIALNDQLAHANSPAMVEEFAREHLRQGKPGDILVIPLSESEITPTPTLITVTTPEPVSNWDVWQAVLFE